MIHLTLAGLVVSFLFWLELGGINRRLDRVIALLEQQRRERLYGVDKS